MTIYPIDKRAIVSVLAVLALFVSTTSLRAQDYQKQIDQLAEDIAATVTKLGLKNVAVLDFTDLQGNTQELGRFLAEELTTSLVLKERSFKTIDRSNLRSILHEQQISMTGIQGPSEAKKLHISGVHGLIRGTITSSLDEIFMNIKIITVEDGTIAGAARGSVPKTSALESLGGDLESSSSSALAGTTSSAPLPRTGKAVVFQDKNLRVTLTYFRKASDDRIKAIFSIESLRDVNLRVFWADGLQLIDDQGEQWRVREQTGLTRSSTNLIFGAPLTALVVFGPGNGTSKATKFNIIGSIFVRDGKGDDLSYISFKDIRLGI